MLKPIEIAGEMKGAYSLDKKGVETVAGKVVERLLHTPFHPPKSNLR